MGQKPLRHTAASGRPVLPDRYKTVLHTPYAAHNNTGQTHVRKHSARPPFR
ncbi:tyrosine-protein kinase HCK-like [Acetobacter orientalis]|uniref:Tyrosine-protein kinase HCK-like, partial n=1 Tax=Acetobacter orientalis TaxID=146474 RepID=A0A2Z5ZGG3_9PROT|nr:tyrosine-protein kinase HCK-like [Acetobacter orientalis]